MFYSPTALKLSFNSAAYALASRLAQDYAKEQGFTGTLPPHPGVRSPGWHLQSTVAEAFASQTASSIAYAITRWAADRPVSEAEWKEVFPEFHPKSLVSHGREDGHLCRGKEWQPHAEAVVARFLAQWNHQPQVT